MSEEAAVLPTARDFNPERAGAWDDLVARSPIGIMMHTRRFISYHGDRFRDRSLVLEDRHGRVVGVFPAAEDPVDPQMIVSHPGITYGGLVYDRSVHGASMVGALEKIVEHYRSLGYNRLRYKVVPAIYRTAPADDDLYALFRLGARSYRCDLAAAIDLSSRGPVSRRRIRSHRRAEAAGVSVEEGWGAIADFWRILELDLTLRHGASPVHSLEEIRLLHDRFPDEILLIVARIDQVLVGGYVLFSVGPVLKTQYTATTDQGRVAFAMDPVIERAIDLARKRGLRFFDFGACTLDDGWSLNEDLYQYKVSFGAGGVTCPHYELDLRR